MQVSWIDAAEVGALVGNLRVQTAPPPEEESVTATHGLLDEPDAALEMFRVQVAAAVEVSPPLPPPPSPPPVEVPHPDLQDFRSRLQAIRERALGAGLLPGTAPAAKAGEARQDAVEKVESEIEVEPAHSSRVPFQPSGRTMAERMTSFAAWAQPLLGWSELFVIGDQGDLLWGQSVHQRLVQTTVMAWVSTSRMSAVFAFDRAPLLRRQMANGQQLTALPCPTRLGLMHIAITSEQPLSDDHVPELRAALILAMESAV